MVIGKEVSPSIRSDNTSQPSQPCLYPFEAIKTQTSHEHLILRVPKKRLTLWWVRANTQQPVLTLQFNPDLSSRTSMSQETLVEAAELLTPGSK
jgi:hypothetical protein